MMDTNGLTQLILILSKLAIVAGIPAIAVILLRRRVEKEIRYNGNGSDASVNRFRAFYALFWAGVAIFAPLRFPILISWIAEFALH